VTAGVPISAQTRDAIVADIRRFTGEDGMAKHHRGLIRNRYGIGDLTLSRLARAAGIRLGRSIPDWDR
jgi:hypothetical protein